MWISPLAYGGRREHPPLGPRAGLANLAVEIGLARQRCWIWGPRTLRFAFISNRVTGGFRVSLYDLLFSDMARISKERPAISRLVMKACEILAKSHESVERAS